ncbi:hypothetical protein HYW55_01695 [Candidatus Gottesmanbacteria bacterium]|nr:hypothetical protein [Candidatus Gottesmanbacteria bacterium]
MKRNFQFNENGQTILEVLIALALIILFLSGVIIVELFSLRNAQYAQNKSIATHLARQQLERARVVRDTAGIDALSICTSANPCFINPSLTPTQVLPTGTYEQQLVVTDATVTECPLPTVTPPPVNYKASVTISWAQGAQLTPAPEVSLSTCITDWR